MAMLPKLLRVNIPLKKSVNDYINSEDTQIKADHLKAIILFCYRYVCIFVSIELKSRMIADKQHREFPYFMSSFQL